ncbi:MAG: hypothetical protein AAFY76_25415, partial [Cyanobacteria bacterium J06649_11]
MFCRLTEESDNNIDHLHDPENMLTTTSADNAGREMATELVTSANFVPGLCGNKFTQDAKPRIYFVSQDAIAKHHGIPSVRVILEQCFDERGEEDVVILCTSLKDTSIVKSALDYLGKASRLYIPYIKGQCPSSVDKKNLLRDLESDSNLVLLSDYRSFRGCEASHSIIILDQSKPNIMAEMLSRTMANLDIIVFLKNTPAPPAGNAIQSSLKTWERRGWVQSTTVHSFDKDESES